MARAIRTVYNNGVRYTTLRIVLYPQATPTNAVTNRNNEERIMNEQTKKYADLLSQVFDAAMVSILVKLWQLDKAEGEGDGRDLRFYLNDYLVPNAAKARTRSMEYSKEASEARKNQQKQKQDSEQFKLSIIQNPQVLASAETLLAHAANYNVPMPVVVEFLAKVGTIKIVQAQDKDNKAQAKSA